LYSEFFLSLLIATFSVVWRFCNVAVIGSSSLVTNNVYRVTLTSFKMSYVFRVYSKVFCRLLPQLTYISSKKQKRFQVQTIFFFSFSNFSYQHYRLICCLIPWRSPSFPSNLPKFLEMPIRWIKLVVLLSREEPVICFGYLPVNFVDNSLLVANYLMIRLIAQCFLQITLTWL
jgi:hypothetical protein